MRRIIHFILIIIGFWAFSTNLIAQQLTQKHNYKQKSSFTENKGQITDQNGKIQKDVKYIYTAPGLKLVLKSNSLSYEVFTLEKNKNQNEKAENFSEATGIIHDFPGKNIEPEEIKIKNHRIDISFVGANQNPQIIAEEKNIDYTNYYLPHTPEAGFTNINSYTKLTYKNLYPNIDLIFYAKEEGKLKYDIVVHPGGKLENVKMKYEGADGLALSNGKLKILSSQGLLEEEIPLSYYEENKKEVKVKHLLNNNQVSFDVKYDKNKTLVIDPTLVWATYYGGEEIEDRINICLDKSGNVYLTGQTKSTTNIATTGSHQSSFLTGTSAFVGKFNSNGVQQWGTYFGGMGTMLNQAIKTDESGNVFLSGNVISFSPNIVDSTAIATSGAHQLKFAGGDADAYLVKFDGNGIRQWGTYFGGNLWESVFDLATDANGNVYLTGSTTSSSGIATTGSYQPFNAGNDAFVVKFNSNGVRQWGTYYGGSENETAISINADANGNVIIAGVTKSTSGIASQGAHQTTFEGADDGFIAKFSSAGTFLWGTYYGGDKVDYATGVNTDVHGNIYLTGYSNSSTGISSPGSHQAVFSGGNPVNGLVPYDAFLAKFNSSGARLWATYYGGTGFEFGSGINVDDSGNVFLGGQSNSTSGIATAGMYQTSFAGASTFYQGDGFIVKFNKNGTRQWGTYYGGSGDEYTVKISADGKGNIYLGGFTNSTSKIATTGSHQPALSGLNDAFLAKFVEIPCYLDAKFSGFLTVCNAEVVSYKAERDTGLTYKWLINGGTILSGQGTDSISVLWARNGYNTIGLVVSSSSSCKDSLVKNIFVNALPNFFISPSKSICTGDKISLGGALLPDRDYSWKSSPAGFNSNSPNPEVMPKVNTTYFLTVTNKINGCKKTDSVTIIVKSYSDIDSTKHNHIICAGDTVKIGAEAKTGNTYNWKSNPPGFTSTISNPEVSPLVNTTYYLTETNTALGCKRTDSVFVKVNPLPEIFAGNDTSICPGKTIKIGNEATPGHSYNWSSFPTGFSSTNANPDVSPLVNTTYFLTETIDSTGCKKTDSVIVTINPLPEPELSGDSAVCANSFSSFSANDTLINALYSWEVTNGIIISGQASKTINVQWQNADPGIVKLTVTNESGCIATKEKTVKINALPTLKLGADTTICPGEKLTFDPGAGFVNYLWQNGSNQQTLEANAEGIYWVEVTDSNGCVARDSIKLSLFNIPEKILGNDTVVCRGVPVLLNAGKDYAAYLWQNGETDQVLIASKPGIYWVEVTTANGCKIRDSINISLAPYPHIDLGPDTVICGGNGITYDAGEGYTFYLWSTGSRERILTVEKPGVYWAVVGNDAGCFATDTVNIAWKKSLDIYIPNAFTPNDDGLNELYNAVGIDETQLFDLKIYSRWGELIFHSTDPNKNWDGKYRGKTAAEGVYLYMLTTQDCQLNTAYKKGTIHLLR